MNNSEAFKSGSVKSNRKSRTRRSFFQDMATGAAGMAAASALANVKAPAMTSAQKRSKQMEFTKSEAEQWAKKHYKGLCGTLCPSFTPDLKELDEESIRHDVRHNLNKGMFSVFCQTEICALTFEERKRFIEIACDEAKSKILVSMFTGIDTIEKDIELLGHFEKIGGTHTLLGWPGMFYPKS